MTARNGEPCKRCGKREWYKNGQCVPCTRDRGKEYYLRNRSKVKERHQNWARQNKDKVNKRARRWAENHPEKAKEVARSWVKRNPEKATAFYHKYRTERTKAGGTYTATEWKALVKRYGGKCLCCGRDDVKLTADHVVPVSKGGTSNIDNLQPLCQTCNSKKRDKIIDYRPDSGPGRWIQKRLFK
jgi:5-methylcytosine-specific restriction endonuclease McrA